MDEYAVVSKSSLKLKCSAIHKKKKKKAESQEKKELQAEAVARTPGSSADAAPSASAETAIILTKAEKSFFEMQEKRQTKRIMEKARKSHKKRVEEFNNHLDSLSEHYDIPKVSWTK